MSNDLLHNLRTAASLLATASTGAEKKSARAQRAAALVASAKGGIKPADAIEAAGLKNISSYYDILRAAKNAGVTEAAKAIVVNRQTYIPKASLADEARFANSPITQEAIREAEAASKAAADEAFEADVQRVEEAQQAARAEAAEEVVDVPASEGAEAITLRYQVRFRDADKKDRKKVVRATSSEGARVLAFDELGAKRIITIRNLDAE